MPGYGKFINGVDPRQLRWSGMIERIQENNPGCPITVWCNEDTPLIWPQILREITDTDAGFAFEGDNDVLQAIMTPEGLAKMEAFLAAQPPANEMQRRRVIAAFLDKFALEDELIEEIDLPGWTPEMVEEMTAAYEEDVYVIERMAGVNFIAT